MKRYRVRIPWHATVIVEVEAKSKAEAIEKGEEMASPSLCWQCSQEMDIDESDSRYPTVAEEVTQKAGGKDD